MFGGDKHYESGDKMFLTCYGILWDHLFQDLCDLSL